MKITDIAQFFQRIYKKTINPARDWLVILSVASVALVGIIIWNVWAFGVIANGGIIGQTATSTPPVFDHSSLDTVRAIFYSRADEEAKYETGTYSFADPSQ